MQVGNLGRVRLGNLELRRDGAAGGGPRTVPEGGAAGAVSLDEVTLRPTTAEATTALHRDASEVGTLIRSTRTLPLSFRISSTRT